MRPHGELFDRAGKRSRGNASPSRAPAPWRSRRSFLFAAFSFGPVERQLRQRHPEGRAALLAARQEFDGAAVGADEIGRDGEAEAGAAGARRTLEGPEEAFA